MKVHALWIDNDIQLANDLKYNICSLDSSFFNSLDQNIDEIQITIVSEPDKAFEMLNSNVVDFDILILDVELNYGKEGHNEYDRLFYEGKAIPAIVVSAFATSPKRIEEIHSKGISIIIDKFKHERLSEEIAKKICQVISNPTERILKIRNLVETLRIYEKSLTIQNETKTIQKWLESIIKSKNPKDKENEIIQEICNECIRGFRIEDDHNKGFTRSDN